MPGPQITEVSRQRLARDALRFGFLGAMLLYTFLPAMLRAGADPVGLRTLWPGAWAGVLAGATAVLGGILYSAGPAWRSTLQAPRVLVNAQFYATALGIIAVFLEFYLAMPSTPGAHPRHGGIARVGGVLLLVGSALFAVNAALAFRSHRSVRAPAGT